MTGVELTSLGGAMVHKVRREMLPPSRTKRKVSVNTGISVHADTLAQLGEMANQEGRSRNKMMSLLLSLSVKLSPKLKRLEDRLKQFESRIPLTDVDDEAVNERRAEAIAMLVEHGLDCQDVDCGKKPRK